MNFFFVRDAIALTVSVKKLSTIVQKYDWVLNRVKGSHHIFDKEGLEL
ncbi:type II toxin-antitoxin system HicA family toxin [Cyanobacterium aponinum]|uniref:Type II toxin-antitoxin system HicA family toxin n=1 Tax=Cyanobacterium aponinum AL20115 TaxID=3090662 RepID=A0AAF1C046_9CHRO|nr:type II toxin-antitoxin system HicA family toxin [Cyanobacterium aponinum]WPF87202.1 type II toxin-antitoxin system HicA family toxin [Cyanobacterium aponinum AL20115]